MGDLPPGNNSRQRSDLARQIRSVAVNPASVPQPSPPRSDSAKVGRLLTSELLYTAVEAGYRGSAWTELQRRLVGSAFPDITRSIADGSIYSRCARAGVGIERRSELQRHPYPEHIATEAVEDCLRRFEFSVLPAGHWDPKRGTSLEDFFRACCLPDVANRWRWHLRQLPGASVPLNGPEELSEPRLLRLVLVTDADADPAKAVDTRDRVAQALAALDPEDRAAFVLWAAGWTAQEICRTLGIRRATLDTRMSRARKAINQRRT
jgi:hypothetical protein